MMDEKYERLADAAAVVMIRPDVITNALDHIISIKTEELLSTQPGDAELREVFYYECRALGELKATLMNLASHSNRKKSRIK